MPKKDSVKGDRMKSRLGIFARLALIVVLVFLVVSIIDKNIEINNLQKKEKEAKEKLAAITIQVEKDKLKLEEPINEETIKRIAKEKLNLRDPDEVAYASNLPD